ncbi:hypothetical protein [Mycolicibacterium sp.]|uniref:hypothetical protein n=1 Tax=Mycolicibacterium sp. TaxID=2320850 RepID=UPI001A2BE76A|nr:hypothetical protein [Mycolicibacterium sp.]MBJ7336268.1 hypothetical protein [Mycolicibacterium sp.]
MATSIIRLAAGVGVAFAIVMAGGPGVAVASADPGSSRSSSDQSRDRGDRKGPRGNQPGARGDTRHGDAPGGGRGQRTGDEHPTTDTSGRGSPARTTPQTSTATTTTASRASTVAPTQVVVPDVSTAPTGGVDRGGSTPGAVGESTTERVVPVVTFGDGRSPGVQAPEPSTEPVSTLSISALPDPPPAVIVVSAPPVPSPDVPPPPAPPLPTTDRDPWSLSDTPVTSFWGTIRPGWPAGVLFGLAGLLLAPIAGVWLGHRQARAVKSASQLVSPENVC